MNPGTTIPLPDGYVAAAAPSKYVPRGLLRVTGLLGAGVGLGTLGSTTPVGLQVTIAVGLIMPPTLALLGVVCVLVWHGLRGTPPGPAGGQLLRLLQIVFAFYVTLVRGRGPES